VTSAVRTLTGAVFPNLQFEKAKQGTASYSPSLTGTDHDNNCNAMMTSYP